jgi:hypothetical protein
VGVANPAPGGSKRLVVVGVPLGHCSMGLSLPFLCENQVPVFPIGFGHRFLPFASAIARRRVDIFRTAFSLGRSCIRSALVLWQSIVFWSGFGLIFPSSLAMVPPNADLAA